MAQRRRGVGGSRLTMVAGTVLTSALCLQCSGGSAPTSPTVAGRPVTSPTAPVPGPGPAPAFAGPPEIFAGAGDIGRCNHGDPGGVARLLDTIGGTLFTLGDNAYMNGTAAEFRDCYEPNWGRHKGRTRPTPGNHDYGSAGAAPYFEYFGANAGPFGLGYYSFTMVGGAWRIISLNSEVLTSIDSPQGAWLQAELKANTSRCVLAYWHKPLFSSGPNGNHPHMRAFWKLLYDHGTDVILSGHDHLYERFALQDPDGRPDPRLGIRQFTVGTGGVPLYDFLSVTQPNSVKQIKQHGILRMTLMSDSYDWQFVPVSHSSLDNDFGQQQCH